MIITGIEYNIYLKTGIKMISLMTILSPTTNIKDVSVIFHNLANVSQIKYNRPMIRCRLQEILIATSTAQRQLARAINVSPTTINLLCQGKIDRVNMPTIDKIMEYFGTTDLNDLFYRSTENEKAPKSK